MKKILLIIVLLIFQLANGLMAQLSNEISFGIGPVFVPTATSDPIYSSASFAAKTGLGLQLDYKLMSQYFGLQLSFNYLANPYDEDYAENILNASSYTSDPWVSVVGMLKGVGRVSAFKNKLLFDFNIGFGLMQSNFPNQIFKYDNTSLLAIDQIYSEEQKATGMTFGTGIRVYYKFGDKLGVFLNYDVLLASQNYTINYYRISGQSNERVTTVKRRYSNLFIGVSFFL